MPVCDFIYPYSIKARDLTDPERLFSSARQKLIDVLGNNKPEDSVLILYATGLTIAYQAAINAAHDLGFNGVLAMHYNRASGDYIAQRVI